MTTGTELEVPGPFGAPVPRGVKAVTLKKDRLNLFNSTVVAVSSVVPAYSLAVAMALLFLTVGVGYAGPAVIWASFVPVLSSPFRISTSTGVTPTAARNGAPVPPARARTDDGPSGARRSPSAARHRTNDEERLGPGHDGFGEKRVRGLV
jgi:hypothetical protein